MYFFDLDNYERIPADECWREYGWGSEAAPGTDVLHASFGNCEVFIDETGISYGKNPEDTFGCEVYVDRDMEGQGFGPSYANALLAALVDAVGLPTMREEGNCEDAVNSIAYRAYELGSCNAPLHMADRGTMDALLWLARDFVQGRIEEVDYEWEDF